MITTPRATPIHHNRTVNNDLRIYWIISIFRFKSLSFGNTILTYEKYSNMIIPHTKMIKAKTLRWDRKYEAPYQSRRRTTTHTRYSITRRMCMASLWWQVSRFWEEDGKITIFQIYFWWFLVWHIKLIDLNRKHHAACTWKFLSIQIYSAINQDHETFV